MSICLVQRKKRKMNSKEAFLRAIEIVESETELPGKMPKDFKKLFEKAYKNNPEEALRHFVKTTKKSIVEKLLKEL